MEVIVSKRVPRYFETEELQLFLGDAFLLLKKMKLESVDMIFADPLIF